MTNQTLPCRMLGALRECRNFIAARADDSWSWLDQIIEEAEKNTRAQSSAPEGGEAVASDARETLVNALRASKGWMTGYAEAFVDSYTRSNAQGVTDDLVERFEEALYERTDFDIGNGYMARDAICYALTLALSSKRGEAS